VPSLSTLEVPSRHDPLPDTVSSVAPISKRKRGPSMSRRSQNGSIEENGRWYVARFRKDIDGKRVLHYERIGPIDPKETGYLTAAERKNRLRELIAASGVNDPKTFVETHAAVTFSEQAEKFIAKKKSRRDSLKPATEQSWRSCLDTWLNPKVLDGIERCGLGDVLVSNIGDAEMKAAVDAMFKADKSAQTIRTYTNLAKMIVGSVKDGSGKLVPRKWDRDEIDAPKVKNQRQPKFPVAIIEALISRSGETEAMLYALLAGTGMRVGEALGLDLSNVSADRRTIHVKESLWQNQLVTPKTDAAVRNIELCQPLAEMLTEFIGQRTQGLLFCNAKGHGLAQSNILRRQLHPMLKELGCERQGFHGFRRFRVTHLRKERVLEGLLRYWIGHSTGSTTDKYEKLDKPEDAPERQKTAESVGLGYSIVRTVRKIEVAFEGGNAQIAA
jgi:integrase